MLSELGRVPVWVIGAAVVLLHGCGPAKKAEPEPHHVGGKVNLGDLLRNTAAYRGKAITLSLKVEEAIEKGRGESLQSYVGREAKFVALAPSGERLELVIRIPDGVPVPAVGKGDDVFVTFVCTRGRLREGNEARSVELP